MSPLLPKGKRPWQDDPGQIHDSPAPPEQEVEVLEVVEHDHQDHPGVDVPALDSIAVRQASEESRAPRGTPAPVPDLGEVEVPRELAEEISNAMKRYPEKRSASIPALWAVQRRYGYCTPEGITEAAAVMGVTPAYLESVASFYDLFRLEPQGEHQVLVCTNISCWLRGADELLQSFMDAAGTERAGDSSEDGSFFVRGFECLGACDIAPMASIDERYYGPLDDGDAARALEQMRAGEEVLPEKRLAERGAAGGPEAGAEKETRILFRSLDEPELASIGTYERLGGYGAIKKAFKQLKAEELLAELEDSGLRGRGGAGFSMGKKASFLPRGEMDKYLCCNADESEPGAFKDRELMQKNPHQLIEGIIIAARAAGANRCFIFIRGEYDLQGDILDAAVAEAYDAGYLGDDVLGTGEQVELVVHRGAGAYICGEETALLDSLEGKRGNPRLKPPFPAVQGLYGGPTLINNVETLSNVPHIVASGADWFKQFGTEQSPGTKVVSISGDVQSPGNYEVELGIPTRELINGLGGGVKPGRELKGFFPGGSSAAVLTAEEGLDLPYSFEALQEAGSMLGSGSIIVFDDTTSVVELALRTAKFYHHESCGKCTPCREGTNWTVKMLERLIRGEATPIDLETIASVQKNIIGNCLCVLGDSMAAPVGSMVEKFRDEFDQALEQGVPSYPGNGQAKRAAEQIGESTRREADYASTKAGK